MRAGYSISSTVPVSRGLIIVQNILHDLRREWFSNLTIKAVKKIQYKFPESMLRHLDVYTGIHSLEVRRRSLLSSEAPAEQIRPANYPKMGLQCPVPLHTTVHIKTERLATKRKVKSNIDSYHSDLDSQKQRKPVIYINTRGLLKTAPK